MLDKKDRQILAKWSLYGVMPPELIWLDRLAHASLPTQAEPGFLLLRGKTSE